jgi:hypothetical protein
VNWYVPAGRFVGVSVRVPFDNVPLNVTGVIPLPVTVRFTCPVGTGVVPLEGVTVIAVAAASTVGLFTVKVVVDGASGAPTPVAFTPTGEFAALLCTRTSPVRVP